MYYVYIASAFISGAYYLFASNPITVSLIQMFQQKEPYIAIISVAIISLFVMCITMFVPVINTIVAAAIISLFFKNKLRFIKL